MLDSLRTILYAIDNQAMGSNGVRQCLYNVTEEDLRDEIKETPARMIKAWNEMFSGYRTDPASLFKVFDEAHDQLVVLRNVEFVSTCEHHFLPFHGVAHIGYIPVNKKVVGVSKLARLVDCFAKRLSIQERICNQVVEAIGEHLTPLGAGCVIVAKHLCISCRGVQKQHSEMVTSALRGEFLADPQVRSEFYSLIKI